MRLHVTIEHLSNGKSEVLYAGDDVTRAMEAQEKSVAAGKALRVDRFFNPAPVAIRYPLAEEQALKRRAIAVIEAVNADAIRKAAEVERKRAQAKVLNSEAKRLESELTNK